MAQRRMIGSSVGLTAKRKDRTSRSEPLFGRPRVRRGNHSGPGRGSVFVILNRGGYRVLRRVEMDGDEPSRPSEVPMVETCDEQPQVDLAKFGGRGRLRQPGEFAGLLEAAHRAGGQVRRDRRATLAAWVHR